MDCKDCGKCTDDSLKHLCFDKAARDELLMLIEEGIKMQMDTENFLYKRGYTTQMMNDLAFGVRMHFDCMLPDKDQA